MPDFKDNHATVLALCVYLDETLGIDNLKKYLKDVRLAQNHPPDPDDGISEQEYQAQKARVNFMVDVAEAMLQFAEELERIKARYYVQFGSQPEDGDKQEGGLMTLTENDLKTFTV